MAVVFISPKKRQRMFFTGITVIFLLFLIAISLGVFLSKPKETSQSLVFNKPKISINMDVFDSDQFENLREFTEMKTLYSYKATKNRELKEGFLISISIEQAKTDLEAQGFTVTELKEAEIGRDNPFIPYYQLVAPPLR